MKMLASCAWPYKLKAMHLHLNQHQRAMLLDMGIRLWQPAPAPDAVTQPWLEKVQVQRAASALTSMPEPAVSARFSAPALETNSKKDLQNPRWMLGSSCEVYADQKAKLTKTSSRCLVLSQTHGQEAAVLDVETEAGKLLDNMLRAAGLHQNYSLFFAPLLWTQANALDTAELNDSIRTLIKQLQPSVLLIMGRVAVQTLLSSTQPFGKQRGQVLRLQDTAVVVTYDVDYLLRNPADKAKAWDDLCLALSVLQN